MSSLYYPFVWMIILFGAGATDAAHGLHHAILDGIGQRHTSAFGTIANTHFFTAGSNRHLQDMLGSDDGDFTESKCSAKIVRDDDFTVSAYGSNSSAICDCTARENIDDVLDKLYAVIPNETTATQDEIDAYVVEFNSALENIQLTRTASCTTECSVCFADTYSTPSAICGVMSYSEIFRFRGVSSGNLTWEEILTEPTNPEDLFPLSSGAGVSCMEFTSVSTGKLCLTVDVATDTNQTTTSLEYNGVTCNSFEFVEPASHSCFIADCSNASPSTILDSCNRTGFVGPIAFLVVLTGVDELDYTLGNCNVSSASPKPTSVNSTNTVTPTVAIATPTTSPIADIESAAPPTVGGSLTMPPTVVRGGLTAPPTALPMAGGAPVGPSVVGEVPITSPTAGRAPFNPPTSGGAPATPTLGGTSNGCFVPGSLTKKGLLLAASSWMFLWLA